MKQIIVLLAALCISCTLLAQRAEMEKVDVKIKRLPARPLPSNIKKYNYRVFNSTPLPAAQTETLNGYLKLDGFQLSTTAPDVTLLVYLDKYDVKMSAGAVKGIDVDKFVYFIKSSLDIRLSFLTGDNRFEFYQTSKLLKEDDTRYTYQSSTTYTTEAAALEAAGKDESMLKRAGDECLNKTLFSIQKYLEQNHGYTNEELSIPVWSMKAKSFDYSDMDEAQSKAIEGLKSFSDNGLNDANKKLFQEAITIWDKVLVEYNPNDKKGRISIKNVGALYANLALTHNWLLNDQDALKYVDLLSNSRGSSWADMIGDLVNSGIKGREQDLKRNNNSLAIEQTKSSLYVSPDFVVKGHSHRIQAIQKNLTILKKKFPDERRFFEYSDNGLLSKTYTETFNPTTKVWEKRRDVHTIKYDHDASVMYTFDDKYPTKPLAVRKFKDGKLISQKLRVGANDSSVVKLYYNASGQLERYAINPHYVTPGPEVRYQYANGQRISKEIFLSKGPGFKPDVKDQYKWNGKALLSTSRYKVNDAGTYDDEPLVIEYRRDGNGFIVQRAFVGWGSDTYTLDDAGNITQIVMHDDQGGSKSPEYVWEVGSGNAQLYTLEITPTEGPEEFPSVY